MNILKKSLLPLTVLCFGCIDNVDDMVKDSDLNNLKSGYEKILSNNKFSCYEIQSSTKSSNENLNTLIQVSDLPNIEIYFGNNNDVEYDDFPNKSIFYENGKKLFILYSEVIENNNGFVVNLCKDTGQTCNVFLPKNETRSVGQNTMDCLADAYANHGWVSVWITIQTGFLPQTAVAMAAACAIKNM